MARIDLPDTWLDVDIAGEGAPVILSSGLAGLRSFWTKQVPALAKKFRVISYDHRGCGNSNRSLAPVSVESMAADLLALMDVLRIDRATLVGHSTGGAIAQYLAAHHPDRLSKIVLACSWPGANPYFSSLFALRKGVLEKMGTSAYGVIGTFFLYPPAHLIDHPELLVPKAAAQDEVYVETVRRRIEAIVKFDARPYLHKIDLPTLVVGAKDDTLTPGRFSEELAQRIKGAELTLLSYGGHYCPATATEEFNARLFRFLEA